jgi:transposase
MSIFVFDDPQLTARAAQLAREGHGRRGLARERGISQEAARVFLHRLAVAGEDGLMRPRAQAYFSPETKLAAVEQRLGGALEAEVLAAFGIRSRSTLKRWVAAYQHEGRAGLADKPRGRPARSKPETLEEKVARLEAENAYLKAVAAWQEPTRPGGSKQN